MGAGLVSTIKDPDLYPVEHCVAEAGPLVGTSADNCRRYYIWIPHLDVMVWMDMENSQTLLEVKKHIQDWVKIPTEKQYLYGCARRHDSWTIQKLFQHSLILTNIYVKDRTYFDIPPYDAIPTLLQALKTKKSQLREKTLQFYDNWIHGSEKISECFELNNSRNDLSSKWASKTSKIFSTTAFSEWERKKKKRYCKRGTFFFEIEGPKESIYAGGKYILQVHLTGPRTAVRMLTPIHHPLVYAPWHVGILDYGRLLEYNEQDILCPPPGALLFNKRILYLKDILQQVIETMKTLEWPIYWNKKSPFMRREKAKWENEKEKQVQLASAINQIWGKGRWSPSIHWACCPAFKAEVQTLLLCVARLQPRLHIEMVHIIIQFLFSLYHPHIATLFAPIFEKSSNKG